ncbi:hypothetical protein K461DRAFT_275657 [Myriangium duriaei CBS 260.36]|uniref:Uncharacterized protein n=1 Tax=Myriangium duriaei CBS 260.36 TaxID=1168546 RepID=A0A9P4J3P9_9PEZI|nr:hypothetical protein K461DRAFT_275657 [Myriangium duriaei CBS 260.36]
MSHLVLRDVSTGGAKLAIILALSLTLAFLIIISIILVSLYRYYAKKNRLAEQANVHQIKDTEHGQSEGLPGYDAVELENTQPKRVEV